MDHFKKFVTYVYDEMEKRSPTGHDNIFSYLSGGRDSGRNTRVFLTYKRGVGHDDPLIVPRSPQTCNVM